MIRKFKIWLLLCLSLAGCYTPKSTDWSVNLSEQNKNPYGLFLVFRSINYLFPEASAEKLDASYRFTTLGSRLKNDTKPSLLLVVGQRLSLTAEEADSILALVSCGHQVFLAVTSIDDVLAGRLGARKVYSGTGDAGGSQCIILDDSLPDARRDFCYRGYPILNYYKPEDSVRTWYRTIGTTENGDPNLIVYTIGRGRLFLHATPFAFTNYFLLQNNNRQYLERVFRFIPPVSRVLWMSFNSREPDQSSDRSVLWNNPSTRMFLLIALLTLLLYVLFEMRRKQKIIPVIRPNVNTSVAFVETIGRLYYNKGNHRNLAEKIVQHFLEFVRSNYFLHTNRLDQDFVKMLAAKSGKSLDKVDTLVWYIREVADGSADIDDSFLFSLHSQIQDFYNNKN